IVATPAALAAAMVGNCCPPSAMKRFEKSVLPSKRPMGGMSTSATKEATTPPTASSITLPRMMNSLNSFSMAPPWTNLVGLPPEKCGHVQILLGRLGFTPGPDVGGHATPPVPGGRHTGTRWPGEIDHLAR